MAKFGDCKFGSFTFGEDAECVPQFVEFAVIKNISNQRIRIYVEPDINAMEPAEEGWLGLSPGRILTVESDRINDGWLYTLRTQRIVQVDYIELI